MTEYEVGHWLLKRPNVVYSYVCCDSNEVTDMVSYYDLSSHVLDNKIYNNIRCAYAWYSFARDNSAERTVQLFRDALVLAKRDGFDSFNATEVC
jgi:glycylpeptide N-tetradecanoyltransferase